MKNVLVDFSNYDALSGFGEIVRNYCRRLAVADVPDMHFVFIIPKKHIGEFGPHIDYIATENRKREIRRYPNHIDLWHATDQQFGYRRHTKGTLQLLTVHDLNYLYEKHGIHLLRHKVEMPWLIHRSDAITVISEYVKKDVEKHIPFLDKEPQVIYNGIDDVEAHPRKQPSFVKDEHAPFFLCIGHVREKKNIHTVVPMMKYFPNHHLYICGANHWAYADKIRSMVAPEDKDRIVLTGKIADEEKCWLMAHADALLFPSKLEGFGIPVLEAMRFGTKVFSSRFSCLPEVCSTHASYWDSYEPEAMAEVVREGLEGWSRDGQEAVDARAYSRTFNYDHYTEQYIALYRQLLHI